MYPGRNASGKYQGSSTMTPPGVRCRAIPLRAASSSSGVSMYPMELNMQMTAS